MGKSEIVNGAGVAGEERLEFVLELVYRPPSIKVLEPAHLASIEGAGQDALDCLLNVRRQLEQHGILLCCMGARPDVWPSGMLRDWSAGMEAYLHREGAQVTEEDVVGIFDPADPADIGTVEEQLAALRKRFQALKDRR